MIIIYIYTNFLYSAKIHLNSNQYGNNYRTIENIVLFISAFFINYLIIKLLIIIIVSVFILMRLLKFCNKNRN